MDNRKKILIIDDDKNYVKDLSLLLNGKYSTISFYNPIDAFIYLKKNKIDVIILDIELKSDKDGLEWLVDILAFDPFLPIIIISSHAHPKIIVEAINRGAVDYIHKGNLLEEIENAFNQSLEKIARLKVTKYLESDSGNGYVKSNSKSMKKIMEDIDNLSKTDCSVLITGESGVGKSYIAKTIHKKSIRFEKNFVIIHSPSISDTLFESELFGHEKGAFTGADSAKIGKVEYAEGGTLLLDEVTETSIVNQAKLLRLIESKEFEKVGGLRTINVDIRFIATTNRDIQYLIKNGTFRDDLYYRLNTFPIKIPPLRDRTEDIIPLAEYAVEHFNKKMNKHILGFSTDAVKFLLEYEWPGNIRELFNMIERCIIRSKNERFISKHHLLNIENISTEQQIIPYHNAVKKNIEEFKIRYLEDLLKQANGKVCQAARLANIPRQSLSRMLKETNMKQNFNFMNHENDL